jgi:hypothetical protein
MACKIADSPSIRADRASTRFDIIWKMKFAGSRSHIVSLSSTWPLRLQRPMLAPVDNQRPAALFGAPLAGCLR